MSWLDPTALSPISGLCRGIVGETPIISDVWRHQPVALAVNGRYSSAMCCGPEKDEGLEDEGKKRER